MFAFLLLFFAGVCNCQDPVDDVYVLNFDSPVYVCPDAESQAFVDTSAVEVQRYNETTAYMTGTIHFLKRLGISTMVEILVDKELSGRYEMVVSHEICALCDEIGNPDSLYFKYLKYFGFPEKCPFDPAPYPVRDFTASDSDLPINAVNAGRYQVTMNFHDNPDGSCKNERTFIGCLKLDFIIEQL